MENSQKLQDLFDKNDTFIIFGASSAGAKALDFLKKHGKYVAYFLDNAPTNDKASRLGYEVYVPTKTNVNQHPVVIASTWISEIQSQLQALGNQLIIDINLLALAVNIKWLKNRVVDSDSRAVIENRFAYLSGDLLQMPLSDYSQYFHPKFKKQEHNIVIDAGAFDAQNALEFINFYGKDSLVCAFELDSSNAKKCRDNIALWRVCDQVELIEKGLWDKATSLHYASSAMQHEAACHVSDAGDSIGELISLDDFCAEKKIIPTLIKMDIEGAEIEAIKGACNVIKNYHPSLAICLYHKPGDLWEIPMLIDTIYPHYDFYIGHHSEILWETVLYCIN